MRVLGLPGVRSIASSGKDPLPVRNDEISAVRVLIASGKSIAPCAYVREGERVFVRDGPLAFLRGVVVRVKNAWRVVVSVEALSCSVTVEVDASVLAADVGTCGQHETQN